MIALNYREDTTNHSTALSELAHPLAKCESDFTRMNLPPFYFLIRVDLRKIDTLHSKTPRNSRKKRNNEFKTLSFLFFFFITRASKRAHRDKFLLRKLYGGREVEL